MKRKHLLLLCFIIASLKANTQRPFITIWNTGNRGATDNTDLTFYATGDNFQIGWVNMSDALDTGNAVGINGANTISFPVSGIYKVYITPGNGSFSAITLCKKNNVNITSDAKKLLSIEQWGDINWSTFNTAFANCDSMVMNAPDMPNLSKVTNMYAAFYCCKSLKTNAAMSNWDVSNVTNMGSMFSDTWNFNQSISNWNVSKVTTMSSMFEGSSFNKPIDNWNVSNVTDMGRMFDDASRFNQPLDKWNVSSVKQMNGMFAKANSFNQPIGKWNVSNVMNMSDMFLCLSGSNFNQPIGNWNVSNVTDMTAMFWGSSFNQPIGNWNVGNVASMNSMFYEDFNFNQPIDNWNVSNVMDMARMFWKAVLMNQSAIGM